MPRSQPPQNKKLDNWYSDDESRKLPRENSRGIDVLRRLLGGTRLSTTSLSESIFGKLTPIWDSAIEPALIKKFGGATTLYIIFYAGNYPGEIIMEIWDPQYINIKPSEVFQLKGIRDEEIRHLPRQREQAEVISLKNWKQ